MVQDVAQKTFKDSATAQEEIKRCRDAGGNVEDLGPQPELNAPLVNVCAKAFKTSITRLLEARSDPNLKDGRNATSLCMALQSSSATTLEVVKLLLFHSANANERDGRGNAPLRYAVRSGVTPSELIAELVRCGARVADAPSVKGGSLVLDALALSSATVLSHLDRQLRFFLSMHVTPKTSNSD